MKGKRERRKVHLLRNHKLARVKPQKKVRKMALFRSIRTLKPRLKIQISMSLLGTRGLYLQFQFLYVTSTC